MILSALKKANGNMTNAAACLDPPVSRITLYRAIWSLGMGEEIAAMYATENEQAMKDRAVHMTETRVTHDREVWDSEMKRLEAKRAAEEKEP